MAVILPFNSSGRSRKDWSQAEQAEFVRVTAILRNAGLPVVVEGGLSDEGDPWTIFLREDTGDVIVHIARVDGLIVAASAASDDVVSGPNFRSVMDRVLRGQPLVLPTTRPGDTVFMHPAAVMTAFVATALMWSLTEQADLYSGEPRSDGQGDVTEGGAWKVWSALSGLLREALFPKEDAVGLNNELNGSVPCSGRAMLAASIAAIAMAAELIRSDLNASPDTAIVQADIADNIEVEPHLAKASVSAAAPLPGEFADETGDAAHSTVQIAMTDGTTVQLAGPLEASDDKHVLVWLDAAHGDEARVGGDEEIPTNGVVSFSLGDPYLIARWMESTGEGHSRDEQQKGKDAAQAAVKPDGGGTEASDRFEIVVPTGGSETLEVHHVKVMENATEFLSLIFDVKSVMASSGGFAAWHVYSGDVGATQLVHALTAVDGPLPTEPVTKAEAAAADATAATSATASTGNTEYRLIDDILAFAFDQEHQLAPTANDLRGLSAALKANPFLPEIDRILVIDLPDLKTDAFRFTDDVVMMSRDLAHELLPHMNMQSQAELQLLNGTSLKLIGVIDLHADSHPAA